MSSWYYYYYYIFFQFRPEEVTCFKEVDSKLLWSAKVLVIWHHKSCFTIWNLIVFFEITKACSGWFSILFHFLFFYFYGNNFSSKTIKIAKLTAKQQSYTLFRQNTESKGLDWLGEHRTIVPSFCLCLLIGKHCQECEMKKSAVA